MEERFHQKGFRSQALKKWQGVDALHTHKSCKQKRVPVGIAIVLGDAVLAVATTVTRSYYDHP